MESVSTAEPLTRDTPCIHCGYNLRGLIGGGMCPECGHAIAESLRGDLLRFANATWLRKVRLGIKMHLWALCLIFILGIAKSVTINAGLLPATIWQALYWFNFVLDTWGVFALTKQEPRQRLAEKATSIRYLLRRMICLSVVLEVFDIASRFVPNRLTDVCVVLEHLLYPLEFAFVLLLLRQLAARIPDGRLYQSTGRLIFVGTILYGLEAIHFCSNHIWQAMGGNPIEYVLNFGSTSVKDIVLMVIGFLAMLAYVVLFGWQVLVLARYKAALTRQLAPA